MNATKIQATGQEQSSKYEPPGAGMRVAILFMFVLYALAAGWVIMETRTEKYAFHEEINSFWNKGVRANFTEEDGNIVALVRLDQGWENTPFGLGLSPDTNSVIVARFVYPVAQYNKKTAENLTSEIKQDIVGMTSGRGAENFDGFAQAGVFAFFGSRISSNLKMSVMFAPFVFLFLVIGLSSRYFSGLSMTFICLNLAIMAMTVYIYSNDGNFENIKTSPVHTQPR